MRSVTLSSDVVLAGYAHGMFPMADSRLGRCDWYAPDPRAILPISDLRIPGNTRRLLRQNEFRITADHAFEEVMRNCAGREETWISVEIERVYADLHARQFAHSVECWHGADLVGGLYGVALGGAFFGESMFHRRSGASDIALVRLVEHLSICGFTLLDIQFINPHLERYGAFEIPRERFERLLGQAIFSGARWRPFVCDPVTEV